MDRRRVQECGCVVGVLLLFSVAVWWIYGPLSLFDQGRLPGCGCGDVVQQVWLLEWAKVGLAHLDLSFLTTRIDYPRGVNLADSASFPLLATLAAPLTAVVGPVATLGFLFRFSVWLTATSTFLVSRRLGLSVLASSVAGAMFAFSPSMVHQASEHVFLVFLPLLPPICALVWRQLADGSAGWRRRGCWLGVLVAAQFLVDDEILLGTGLVLLIVVVVFIGCSGLGVASGERRWRRDLVEPALGMVKMLAVCAAIAVPIAAYPTWVALAGHQHVVGPTQQPALGIDPAASVFPSYSGVLAWHLPLGHPYSSAMQQDTAFIGLAAVLAAALSTWCLRRSGVVLAIAATAVLAWILALGPRLVSGDGRASWSLPLSWVYRTPGLQDLVPSRMMLLADLCVALLLAMGLQKAIDTIRHRARRGRALTMRSAVSTAASAAAIAGLIVAAIGLIPDSRIPATSVAFGASATNPTPRSLTLNGVVLAVPYPDYNNDEAMLWQAEDDLNFSLLGGYANRPRADGTVTKAPLLTAPRALTQFLFSDTATPTLPPQQLDQVRRELPVFLHRWHVRWIVTLARSPAESHIEHLHDPQLGQPHRIGDIACWKLASNAPNTASPEQSRVN